jgi:RHS repeat-associated protein
VQRIEVSCYHTLSYVGEDFYGRNGDLQTKISPNATSGTDTTRYTYDAFGNLTRVVMPNDDVIQYVIDGQNRRIAKKVNGRIVDKWLYAGQLTPVAELDSANDIIARFSGGYMNKRDTIYQIITDHLGSPKLVVNVQTGIVVQKIDYDEFGNVTFDSNPGFQPFGFAGGLYDPETKLVRFGARDYDAETGRWTKKDPIGFGGRESNLYEYVVNDPIQGIDPSGLQGIGITYGAQGELGSGTYGAGLGGQVFGGAGLFYNPTNGIPSAGAFAGGGKVEYQNNDPYAQRPCEKGDQVWGVSAGAGVGVFFTNAKDVTQLGGPFSTLNVNLYVVSIQIAIKGSTWYGALTFGKGIGLSTSSYTTQTPITEKRP